MPVADGFLGDGIVTTDFGGTNDSGKSVAVQADGKILVAGASDGNFALVRYNSDGSLDSSFDFDGVATIDFGGYADTGFGVTVQTDGKILVAGQGNGGASFDFALARYNADGTLDTSFDFDGVVTTDISTNSVDVARSVAVQVDGKILVAGASVGGGSQFALARYNADGSLDTSFDSDGIVTTGFGSSNDQGASVTVQDDGKMLVAGHSTLGGGGFNFALARYNADGSPDVSFDFDGAATTNIGASFDQGRSVTVQADGKILVAGIADTGGGNFDFALARYNADGSLDPSFDTDGIVTTDIAVSSFDQGQSVALQADGKILVAGTSAGDFALARYNTDGSLDASFDADGIVTTDFGGSSDEGFGVTVQSDGKILVAGNSNAGGRDFALARYNADGSLDTMLNAAPIITSDGGGDTASILIDENVAAVTTVEAIDDDAGDVVTYSISGGVDGGLFEINSATGELSFLAMPDFENPFDDGGDNTYDVIVQADDGNGGVDTQEIAVAVANQAGETWVGGNGKQVHTGTGEEDVLSGGNGKDIVDGAAGDDIISGGNGKDTLIGGAGNDWLTGDKGKDTFVFAENFGNDVITDFSNDVLEFETAVFSDSADVLANATQIGSDTVITYDAENTITLQGVAYTSLDEGNFSVI
ncbi:MAG: hypothetical protein JXQ99_28180 [Hyphomicrobiaceae bacterium]